MKKNMTSAVLGIFGLFCLLVVIYNFLGADYMSRETQSSKKSAQEKRALELGQVKNQTDKVIDEPSALFNDPAIKQAWGLKKSDAARAWSVTQGSRDTIVAVIDTGVDETHEDLATNLWVNPGETGKDANGKDKATNGIDDDENGFIDDVHGWNFVSNNNQLEDNHGHGTHIAGIIGAEAGNKKGISGISPKVSLMILKYFDPKVRNTDNLKNTIAAIKYAVKMGAHIINYSGGGTDYSQDEYDAVALAEKKGILFVAAAGNEKSNSDQYHYYPADYKLKNIISVTAIDPTTEILTSSNYGVDTVDIAAPGQNILSCLPHNSYGLMTGTSQATAFISGAAALVMSHKNQYYKAEEIKKYILSTGDTSHSLIAKTKTARQLNLFKALTILGSETAVSGVTSNSVYDSFLSDAKGRKSNNEDPNLEKVNSVATFGKQLLENLNPKPGTKKKTNRLGIDQQQKQQEE
jgi:thermitase